MYSVSYKQFKHDIEINIFNQLKHDIEINILSLKLIHLSIIVITYDV